MTSRQEFQRIPAGESGQGHCDDGGQKARLTSKKAVCQTLAWEIFCHVTQDFKATFQTSQHLYNNL